MHYAYSPTARNVAIERVEILTKDNILPTTDYVASPTGWGAGLTNNNYVSAILNIYNAANELVFTSESIANETDAYSGGKIKIRGNTSAYGIKKPYKIKLSSEIDLLGLLNSRNISDNRSNKEWLLLAQGEYTNYFVGREVSNLIDSDNYLDYKYISLFLNGDFKGIYILSDSINDKTCNVSNTGYLVENDAYWWNEDVYFETTISSMYKQLGYTFKYPDTDELSNEQIEYIKNYISNYESLLMNKDVNVSNYIDMNSFSKWLLIHDILVTNDAGGSNMYLKKNDNSESKMMSGPAWDFDSIFKGTNYLAPIRSGDFYIFKYLLEYNEFEEQYKANYNLIRNNLITQLDSRWANIYSPELDNLHQLYLECYNTNYKSLNEQYTYAINFITEHLSYMDTVI
jgi:hypothetical protein